MLGIDGQTKHIYKMIQSDKEGMQFTVTINSFKTNQPLSKTLFTFDEDRYRNNGYYINVLIFPGENFRSLYTCQLSEDFLGVFIILMFIFVLQTIWLYISELAGKDLDAMIILKFLWYFSPK